MALEKSDLWKPGDGVIAFPPPSRRSFRTRAAHSGDDDDLEIRPLSPSIHQGAVYAFADGELADAAFAAGDPLYARDGLPNSRALERAVADLEGVAMAQATSSGMAAITLTLLSFLSAGDHLVAPIGCYCDTEALLHERLTRFGIDISLVDYDDPDALKAAITARTRVVFAETISNPGMILADLRALADLAHAAGALLVVDNTLATPALCRPAEHGADLVLHSAGKFLGGHHDVTAGVVAGPAALMSRIRRSAYLMGPLLAPVDAWLTLRGLKTLAPRMAWVCQSAREIAAFLAAHPAIESVRYPGFPTANRRALTERLLPDGAGGVLAFDLAGGALAASRLLHDLALIPYVPSLGGPTTIASYPPQAPRLDESGRMICRPYQSGTVRLSVGLEDPADVRADLRRALDAGMLD